MNVDHASIRGRSGEGGILWRIAATEVLRALAYASKVA